MTLPLRLDIDLSALAANWRWFRDASHGASGRANTGAAIKADGYGLGADAVMTTLAGAGCRDFFVTTMAEAELLLPLVEGVTLYTLHGIRVDEAALPDVVPVLNSAAQIAHWRETGGGSLCDVMVDTGMNRLGIDWRDFRVDMLEGLNIGTLHSHLACADDPASGMNENQLERFRGIVDAVQPRRASLAGSGGVCLGADYIFGLTRPGLGLYGGIPHPAASGHLQTVVRPQAQIITVRNVPAGDSVGYGASWTAGRDTRVATINLGYADGYLRSFSNCGHVLVGGRTRPIIGRVSMDLSTVDLGEADAAEGDWVQIDYDLPSAAKISGISQYELLTGLGHRYQRRYL